MSRMLERCGYRLGCWLSTPRRWHRPESRIDTEVLACPRPGDVLLVEGASPHQLTWQEGEASRTER